MTYPEAISTIAIALSGLSLWLHWLKARREKREISPEVSVSSTPIKGLQDWYLVKIFLRNRANFAISAEQARVVWPLSARIVGVDAGKALRSGPDYDPGPERWKLPDKSFRSMPLNLSVAHAGQPAKRSEFGFQYAAGDTHSTEFLLFNSRSRCVSLRISFKAQDTSNKVRTRRIKARTVAPAQANSIQ